MAGKRIYSCVLLFAIIVLTSNQQSQGHEQKKHFVLIHGAGHGAWCWFKVQPLLEAIGHNVTSLDMAASGIDLRNITDIRTYDEYTQPLVDFLASIPENEKVILVGHSQGGLILPFGMEKYPHKVEVAVFITAFMPDDVHPPSYVPAQFAQWYPGQFLDTEPHTSNNLTYAVFGPRFVRRLYSLSRPEDLALAEALVRPTSGFDLANRGPFSKEKYGSVKRAFIVITNDEANPVAFQRWNINNTGVAIVKEITGADHMAMISQPVKLFQALLDIAYDSAPWNHFSL